MVNNSTLIKAIVATSLAVGFAGVAGAADLTCHLTPQETEAAKTQIVKVEGMIPVTSHFGNVGTDSKASWALVTALMNPNTKKGYEWIKSEKGFTCVSKSYSNFELISNISLSAKSLLDTRLHPRADDKGDGVDTSSAGINRIIALHSLDGKNPMYRATIDDAIDVTGKATKTTGNVEFLVANPVTKDAVLLTAAPSGKVLGNFTRVAGNPAKDGPSVQFGAIYSPAAEEMLKLQRN